MLLLSDIDDSAKQEMLIEIKGEILTLTFYFLNTIQSWFVDFEWKNKKYYGFKLCLGVRLLRSYNFPFDFILQDTSKQDIDPFLIEDFSSKRINFYILTTDELEEIRGYPVEI